MSEKGMNSSDKYVQGSVWRWTGKRNGEKSDSSIVLIASNTQFNRHSPVVNVVLVSTAWKDSATNIPVFINKEANIQCEQMFTANKHELVDFMGIIPDSALNEVRRMLRTQFDCDIETPLSQLAEIKAILKALNEKADKGFGLPETEDTFLQLMSDMHLSFTKVVQELERTRKIAKTTTEPPTSAYSPPEKPASAPVPPAPSLTISPKTRKSYNSYTEDDKKFILDKSNSIELIMEKYKLPKRQTVHDLRYKFIKRSRNANNTQSACSPAKRFPWEIHS